MKTNRIIKWLGWLNRILGLPQKLYKLTMSVYIVFCGASGLRFKITSLIKKGLKMITTITKRAVSGRLLTHVVGATFRLRDIAPAIFRRLKPAATILLILWCVAPGSSASAKEVGGGEDLYVGRNTTTRSEEHTSELQSQFHLVCRL